MTLPIPPDSWIASAFVGAVAEMMYVNQWSGDGDILPSQAAAVAQYAVNHVRIGPTMLGEVLCFALDNMDHVNQDPAQPFSQYRKCDGAAYLTTDYPDLFALIGYTFGGAGPTFNVPDLRGRVIIDAGQGPGLTNRVLGDTPGEEAHTLVDGEVPTHSHVYTGAATTAIAIGPGAPAPSAIPFAGTTGTAGGGGAHNNIQPSLALFYYIVATM